MPTCVMSGTRCVLAAVLAVALPTAGQAASLQVTAAWLRAAPRGATVLAGYATITNGVAEFDRLLGARIAIAGPATVHTMSMAGGVMRMRSLPEGLPIAPGATLTLRPGGDHLMFAAPTSALVPGGTIAGTLIFANAGNVPVRFTVGAMGATVAPAAPVAARAEQAR
jgi:periplasmic copper chaperone A